MFEPNVDSLLFVKAKPSSLLLFSFFHSISSSSSAKYVSLSFINCSVAALVLYLVGDNS
jgi:hypothetical protein